MRQAVARGGRRRVRGDRLPGVLRASCRSSSTAGRRLSSCPASVTRCATSPRGIVAVIAPVELPARDPGRDGGGGARHRQHRVAQARRAVSGCALMLLSSRCAPQVYRRRALACCRGTATPARPLCAIRRAHDRLHRLLAVWAWRSCARRPRRGARARAIQTRDRRDGGKNCVSSMPTRTSTRRSRDRASAFALRGPKVLGRGSGVGP